MRIPGSSRKHRVVIPNTGQTLAQAQKQGALEAQRMEAAAIAAEHQPEPAPVEVLEIIPAAVEPEPTPEPAPTPEPEPEPAAAVDPVQLAIATQLSSTLAQVQECWDGPTPGPIWPRPPRCASAAADLAAAEQSRAASLAVSDNHRMLLAGTIDSLTKRSAEVMERVADLDQRTGALAAAATEHRTRSSVPPGCYRPTVT